MATELKWVFGFVFVLILVGLGILAAIPKRPETVLYPSIDLNDPRVYTSSCIKGHLDEMAGSDHVQSWDESLYRAVAETCWKLWMPADKPFKEVR